MIGESCGLILCVLVAVFVTDFVSKEWELEIQIWNDIAHWYSRNRNSWIGKESENIREGFLRQIATAIANNKI